MATEFRNLQVILVDSPVQSGDVCQVWVSFEYISDVPFTKTLYASIGVQGLTFNELLSDLRFLNEFDFPIVSEWSTGMTYVSITITDTISGGVYDVYAKLIGDGNDIISPTANDIVEIIGSGASWLKMISSSVSLAVVEGEINPASWLKMISSSVAMSVLVGEINPSEWVKMISQSKSLSIILDSDGGDGGDGGEEFNWLPIVLIGGGVGLLLASIPLAKTTAISKGKEYLIKRVLK
jgi:hypothetical protein